MGPAHPGPWRSKGGIVGLIDDIRLRVCLTGHDLGPQGGIGGEYAMEANVDGVGDEGRVPPGVGQDEVRGEKIVVTVAAPDQHPNMTGILMDGGAGRKA